MQKDLTQSLLQTGQQPPHASLLSAGSMEQIGKELIQLCDQLEQHGLVDYQMGVWEEEILSGMFYSLWSFYGIATMKIDHSLIYFPSWLQF